ncbi:MAG: hypothetical protein FJW35_03365 [Acidobacteria bacterium]|nr:hypothetical protein [Acidobacteriota bacterium]
MNPPVYGASVRPSWLDGDRFWYCNHFAEGDEFVLVDPARGVRSRAFDHAALAAALSADGRSVSFEAVKRRWTCDVPGQKCAETKKPEDRAPGTVRTIMEGRVPTFFESADGAVNWQALPASNELVWFSQRDDRGHLRLCDLTTGRLKHQITKGPWNVLQIRRIDEGSRTIYFTGAGREPGDPIGTILDRLLHPPEHKGKCTAWCFHHDCGGRLMMRGEVEIFNAGGALARRCRDR